MESSNMNKGDGLAGKSKADNLRAFMHTKTRRAIGDLKNPNASFDVHRTHDGSGPDVDHTRVSTFVGSDSESGTRDTDMHESPNLDAFLDGEKVKVLTFARRTSSSLIQPHKNVTASFTSLGESTNPILSTMNPSKVQYPKPFKSLWGASDESFVVTNDVPSPNLVNKDSGVNLNTSQVEKPSHESPIVHSVKVNTIPKSYVGAAGADTNDQSNVIMAILDFHDTFAGAHALFQPYHTSDHAPAILKIPMISNVKPKTFKFANVLVHDLRFKDLVKAEWSTLFSGFHMFNGILIEEAVYVRSYNDALMMEERFLKQKAKVDWLHIGDSNSAYFHKVVKGRVHRSRIDAVMSTDGTIFVGDQVTMAFEAHYSSFLGQQGINHALNFTNLFIHKLDSDIASHMIHTVSNQKVKEAIFSMGNDKSPSPDGYTTAFFKEAWDIVSKDVTQAVTEFFINGNLLKEVNHTIIALIPKVSSPTQINDYRLISCCNVIYKCISKILANRIKDSLKTLVSPNQSAFVLGQRITDNILLTQEIMHNYHLDRGPPRCAFKVDIQKAYDTVDWEFLREILIGFGFHPRDPLSSYLFTLIMEVFTLMLHCKVSDSESFTYHRYCEKLNLINLCFADDLFLFAHGDANSARVIMACLDEFKDSSILVPKGLLPVKYLGVPLISFSLVYRDCKELIDKVRSRIQDWKNNSLSAAGRLQLIRSVIGSMHIYWASAFILPSRILLEIEQLMRGFLWCQGDLRKGKAKVAWDVVSLPRREGGLGIRKLDVFNKALMISHIWRIISARDIHRAGFSMTSKLSEVSHIDQWVWQHEWYLKYPSLSTIDVPPALMDSLDTLEWRHMGLSKPFTVTNVWEAIRPRGDDIHWCDVVWNQMKVLAGLSQVSASLNSTVDYLIPISKWRSARGIVAKLVFAASSYFIRQERNYRLFKNQKRSPNQLVDCIKNTVLLKLLTCTFKKTRNVMALMHLWKLPDSVSLSIS
ncbi:hypothetical protein Tco_0968625 [Tanacetum coccineum]